MNKDEQMAEQFLVSRGLSVERFSKIERRQTKTPDFKVLKDGRLAFYCEVKGVAEDEEFEQRLDSSPAGSPVAKGGKDTTLDHIERKIHEAAEQFRAVDPEHETLTVLVFVNRDWSSDWGHLRDVLTGCFFADDGFRYPIYAKYSEGKIRDVRHEIDLCIWLHNTEEPRFFFSSDTGARFERLCGFLGINQSTPHNLSKHPLAPKSRVRERTICRFG